MALVEEDAVNNSFDSLIDRGVIKDDICAFSA
jgi:hypothetical protein